MKTKALTVLLVCNALLFGFALYFFKAASHFAKTPHVETDNSPALESPRKRTGSRQADIATARSSTVYVTNKFHWSSVESTDYREYIANLRAIGCPESTVKDIIITDIMRLYAARRGRFYHNGREFKFWETNEKRKLNAKQLEERERQLATIDKEIPAILRELLGINYEREINRYFVDTNEDERRLSFISEEKRSRVLALREEIEAMREKLLESGSAANTREELAKIEEHRRTMLRQILTETELEEFELRTSETAEHLRNALVGFNPSEEEFRQIYSLQKAIDEKFAFADPNDQQAEAAKFVEQSRLEEEIRKQLGDARYAEYLRAKQPDFQSAVVFTELYELPQSVAASLVEIKQIAEQEKLNLLATPNIPEDLRLAALRAIQEETEKNLSQLLGTKLLSNYTQSSGTWVQNLGSAN